MNALVIIEWLGLIALTWFVWRRSRTSWRRHGLVFALFVVAMAAHVGVNLWGKGFVAGLEIADDPIATLNRSAYGILLVQVLRTVTLLAAGWCWLVVTRPRLTRSWRGWWILICLLLIVALPDVSFGLGFPLIVPLLRVKWTRDLHGWGRFLLVIALGILTVLLSTSFQTRVDQPGVATIDAMFGSGQYLTEVDGDLPGPAAFALGLVRPWERAIVPLLVLIRLQVALAFLQLLVVPIRLRGLSLKRRFSVTLAMYRFIPGTLALIFMILIAYLGIGLHRASVIQHTFDATLERGLRATPALLDARGTRGPRLPAVKAAIAEESAYGVVRDLELEMNPEDSTTSWRAQTRAWSPGTPVTLIDRVDLAQTEADTSIGLTEAGGTLYLRAACKRRSGDRATSAEVYVPVDTTYLAALARRVQSDVLVDVSASVFIGEGSVQIVGGADGGWADSSFTTEAAFPRTVTHDDVFEKRLYLARSFLAVGNWLDDIEENNRIGAVQVQLYTTLRGLGESLTSNPLVFTSQLPAIIILAGIAILFLIVELSAVRTGRSIVKGIVTDVKNLTVAARKFGEGDLTHRVELSGKDEMGQLAATFNSMAANIEQHQEVLLEKQRLEADLALARDIQQRMLPQSPPVIPGLDIAGLSIPSREVGGDLFYFLPVSNGRLGLTIGDVSGKSVPAALLMSNVLAALKSEARIVDNEDEILNHLNRLIVEQVEPGRFVTFFYGVVDPAAHVVRYACAGHNPPLIMRANGEAEWLHEAGVPLGVVADSTYAPVEASLRTGDVLVLYSDGVTEAQRNVEAGEKDKSDDTDDTQEFFDEHRLETAVRDALGKSAAAVITHIMDSIRTFTAGEEQSDDLTLVVVRMLP